MAAAVKHNPNWEGRDKVLELMAQAQKHSGVKPGTPAKPLRNYLLSRRVL
jgi:hypothetical protein